MTANPDAKPARGDESPDPDGGNDMFPPASDGEPGVIPPKPLDEMPVPPLTEPADTNGG